MWRACAVRDPAAAQGFYFARPLEPAAIQVLLEKGSILTGPAEIEREVPLRRAIAGGSYVEGIRALWAALHPQRIAGFVVERQRPALPPT